METPLRARQLRSRVVSDHDKSAAQAATEESRLVFTRWLSGRPLAAPRRGRPTTGGNFAALLTWQADAYGMVDFDVASLAAKAPYWVIQEIGSGQSARVLNQGGSGVTVRSQIGRRLPPGFYWADGPGSPPTRKTGSSRRNIPAPFASPSRKMAPVSERINQQQLYPSATAGPGAFLPSPGKIRHNIKPKHFVQLGGLVGFDLLYDLILADFNKSFPHSP